MNLYVTHGHHGDFARPMQFWHDSMLLNPHGGDKSNHLTWPAKNREWFIEKTADSDVPLFLNFEAGTDRNQLDALRALRSVTDRRLIPFYRRDESILRELPWSLRRICHRDEKTGRVMDEGWEQYLDATTVYGRQAFNDRDKHTFHVLADLQYSRERLHKAHYLFTCPHIDGAHKSWGDLREGPLPVDTWRWEIETIWPHFDGIIVWAPRGWMNDELAAVTKEVAQATT